MASTVTINSTADKKKILQESTITKTLAKVLEVPNVRSKEVNIPSVTQKVDQIANAINDAHSTKQVLPDVKLAQAILTSSIISPQDLNSGELSYHIKGVFEDVAVAGEMLKVVKDHFDTVYRMQEELPKILDDALFDKGSHVKVIIPESEIKRIIESHNAVSFESVKLHFKEDFTPARGVGLLGKGLPAYNKEKNKLGQSKEETVSFENFFNLNSGDIKPSIVEEKFRLSITDNPVVLRLPSLVEKIRSTKLNASFENNVLKAVEAYKEKTRDEINKQKKKNKGKEGEVYQPPLVAYGQDPVVATTFTAVDEVEEDDIATVIEAPPESVIPVFGQDPSKHVGYWFVTDAQGYFIKRSRETNYYNVMGNSLNSSQQSSQILNQTMTALFGVQAQEGDVENQDRLAQYSEIVTKELLTRLHNGMYKEELSISARQDLYKVMFARALEGKRTQLLYVPAEYVCYFAFDFNEQGIGESLLEQTKIIASIRSAIMLSDTMAHVRNSIGRTLLEIEFDGSEPDPLKLKEYVVHEYINSRSPMFPIGEPNPVNMINYLRRAGVEVKMSGHDSLPNTKVNIDNFNTGIALADTELGEVLKRRHYMGFGLSPEVVDEANDLSLATSVVKRDLLLTKNVMKYQNKLMPITTKFVRTVIRQSGKVVHTLYEKLEKIKGELPKPLRSLEPHQLIDKFISSIFTQLPTPDSTTLDNQVEGLSQYAAAVEEALEFYFSEEIFNADTLGELEVSIPVLRRQLHSMLVRRYMRSNNILPELDELVSFGGDEESPVLLELESHVEAITNSLSEHMKKIKENLLKAELAAEEQQLELDKKREEAEAAREPEEEEDDDIGSDEGDEADDDGDDTGDDAGDGEAETGDEDNSDDEGGDLISDDDTGEEGEEGEEGAEEESDDETDNDEGGDLIKDDEETEEQGEEEPEEEGEGDEEPEEEDEGGDLISDDDGDEEEPEEEDGSDEDEGGELIPDDEDGEEPEETEDEDDDEDDENKPLID